MSVTGAEPGHLKWCQGVTAIDELEKRVAAVHHGRQGNPSHDDPDAQPVHLSDLPYPVGTSSPAINCITRRPLCATAELLPPKSATPDISPVDRRRAATAARCASTPISCCRLIH